MKRRYCDSNECTREEWSNDTAEEDQRCVFEIMTAAREIKIFLCWVYFWEEVASEWRHAIESNVYYVREKEEIDAAFVSPLISHSLIDVCSSEEYRYPGEKTSPFLARKAVLFPAVVLANARVSLWIIEKGAQCTLCIVEVSKDLCHRQLHQNGRSVFRVRDCPRLTFLKVYWSCQPNTKPFPLFLTERYVIWFLATTLILRWVFSKTQVVLHLAKNSRMIIIFSVQFLLFFILSFHFSRTLYWMNFTLLILN